jgi:hypothetical protein
VAASVASVARIAALKAASALQSKLFASGTFSGSGDAGFSGFSGGGTEGAGTSSSSQADSFLATLPPPPAPRRSGFDLAPPNPAQFQAGASGGLAPLGGLAPQATLNPLAMAMAIAQQLNQHATAAQMAAPKKSLYEILSRDRERIAAADLRNQQYVLDQKAAQKQRAKEQHAAQEQATAVATAAAANSAKRPKTGQAAPASAGSVYVTGVPAGASWTELEDHFGQVGPVQRVKLYKDANGATKGDALVVYQKEASVLGATQLLNGKPPSPRCNPATRRDATLRAAFLHATVRVCYEPPATACGQPAAACHLQARCCGRVCPSRSRRRSLTADPHRRLRLRRRRHLPSSTSPRLTKPCALCWCATCTTPPMRQRTPRRGGRGWTSWSTRCPAPPPRLHRACTSAAPQLHLSCTPCMPCTPCASSAAHLQPICTASGVARVLPARRGAAHRHLARLRRGALRFGHLGGGSGRRPRRPLLRRAHAQG